MKLSTLLTKNPKETQEFAINFVKKLQGGDIIALYGNLGAGKTTFVQGLAKGLGITRRITSPTFIIVRSYEVKNHNEIQFLYHLDLYRIETMEDLKNIGFEELVKDKKNIVLIEWAEKLGTLLPKKRWDIRLEVVDENKRSIYVQKH